MLIELATGVDSHTPVTSPPGSKGARTPDMIEPQIDWGSTGSGDEDQRG